MAAAAVHSSTTNSDDICDESSSGMSVLLLIFAVLVGDVEESSPSSSPASFPSTLGLGITSSSGLVLMGAVVVGSSFLGGGTSGVSDGDVVMGQELIGSMSAMLEIKVMTDVGRKVVGGYIYPRGWLSSIRAHIYIIWIHICNSYYLHVEMNVCAI